VLWVLVAISFAARRPRRKILSYNVLAIQPVFLRTKPGEVGVGPEVCLVSEYRSPMV
jgi:hypothetical protein